MARGWLRAPSPGVPTLSPKQFCAREGDNWQHTPTRPHSRFPTRKRGFLRLRHPHTLHPFASCSLCHYTADPCSLSPYSLGCFTSPSLSTLLLSSFDDSHVRTHARSPEVPSVGSSRNRSVQSPPLPTQAARCKSAKILNCTGTLTPALLCHSPARRHASLLPPSLPTPREVSAGLAEAN